MEPFHSQFDPDLPSILTKFTLRTAYLYSFSGTYLAIAICREWLKRCASIDLTETVRRLRSQRAFAVQTPEQYQFCLLALKEELKRMNQSESRIETNEIEKNETEVSQ